MDVGLLTKLFGKDQQWQGPCILVLDAAANIHVIGNDSIQGGGAKVYGHRVVSGRLQADTVCLLQDGKSMVLVTQQRTRQATGEETIKHTMLVVDTAHIVAVEFADTNLLAALGLSGPVVRTAGSHPGLRPRPA